MSSFYFQCKYKPKLDEIHGSYAALKSKITVKEAGFRFDNTVIFSLALKERHRSSLVCSEPKQAPSPASKPKPTLWKFTALLAAISDRTRWLAEAGPYGRLALVSVETVELCCHTADKHVFTTPLRHCSYRRIATWNSSLDLSVLSKIFYSEEIKALIGGNIYFLITFILILPALISLFYVLRIGNCYFECTLE